LFLKNALEKNLADPRLALAQTIGRAAMQLAQEHGDGPRSVAAQGKPRGSASRIVSRPVERSTPA